MLQHFAITRDSVTRSACHVKSHHGEYFTRRGWSIFRLSATFKTSKIRRPKTWWCHKTRRWQWLEGRIYPARPALELNPHRGLDLSPGPPLERSTNTLVIGCRSPWHSKPCQGGLALRRDSHQGMWSQCYNVQSEVCGKYPATNYCNSNALECRIELWSLRRKQQGLRHLCYCVISVNNSATFNDAAWDSDRIYNVSDQHLMLTSG